MDKKDAVNTFKDWQWVLFHSTSRIQLTRKQNNKEIKNNPININQIIQPVIDEFNAYNIPQASLKKCKALISHERKFHITSFTRTA